MPGYRNKSKEELLRELESAHRRIREMEQSAVPSSGPIRTLHFQPADQGQGIPDRLDLSCTLFKNAVVGLYYSTPEGRFLAANQSMADILGFHSPAELISWYTDVRHQLYVDPFKRDEFLHRLETDGFVRNMDYQVYTKSGRIIWISNNVRIVRNQEGQAQYFEGCYLDITQRKEAEAELKKSQERYALVLEGTSDGIWDWDLRSGRVFFSRRWKEIIGYEEREIADDIAEWKSRIHPDDYAKVMAANEQFLLSDATHLEVEYRLRHKDGGYRWILGRGACCRDAGGRPVRIAGAHSDITQRKQAEESLKHSERSYRLLADNAKDVIWTTDRSLRTSYISPSVQDMFGYSPEEAQGAAVIDHLPLELLQPAQREVIRAFWLERLGFPQESSTCLELQQVRKDGSRFWSEVLVSPLMNEEGLIQGFQGSTRDITAQKEALEELKTSKQRLHDILLFAPQIAVSLDQEGKIIFANRFLLELTGWREEEILGRSWFDTCLPEENRESLRSKFFSSIATRDLDSHSTSENEIMTRSGERRTVSWSNVFTTDSKGTIHDITSLGVDVTERKKHQEGLRQAKEMAESANRSKSEFLANMSHEIRTPLNGVLGMLQLLQTTELDPEQDEYVEVALKSSRRLTRLLTDILDLSKVEAGKLELREEEFCLPDIMQSIEDIFHHTALQKGNALTLHLERDVPHRLFGDHVRLNQILFNLVGNAMKFTRNGSIEVHGSLLPAAEHSQCRLLFTVSDTGAGIPEDKLSQVFETFSQANASPSSYSREHQGAGLGLSIVKRIAALMDGGVSLESEEGRGTTAYVSLSFTRPQAAEPLHRLPQSTASQEAPCKGRVLVADDDETTRLSLKRLLRKLDFEVEAVDNGESARKRLLEKRFDCVLMDIQMPVMDGLEAARRIRQAEDRERGASPAHSGSRPAREERGSEPKRRTPIIALTGYAMAGDKERFLRAGMSDYLAKPVHKEDLLEAVRRNLGLRRQ